MRVRSHTCTHACARTGILDSDQLINPYLTSLVLGKFPGGFSDINAETLATRCPSLHHLSLGGCEAVTDAGVGKIAENLPRLELLNLAECFRVTDIALGKLATCCPDLRTLTLGSDQNTVDAMYPAKPA